MKKFLSKTIVLAVMVAIFLAPFSPTLKIDKKNNVALNIEIKKTEAQSVATKGCGETTPCVYIEKININRNSAKFAVKIVNIKGNIPSGGSVSIEIKLTGNNSESQTITKETMDFPVDQNMEETKTKTLCIGQSGCDYNDSTQLTADTGYTLITGISSTESKLTFQTAVEGSGQEGSSTDLRTYSHLDLGCNDLTSFSISSCVAQIVYGIWSIVNEVARLAAHILDFFVYYSTNSSSYDNEFAKEGWGAVRDIANILFIIALLYIAVKTVLGLNVSDNKKLIGTVIIMALLINFSLFTTKVVIDASNILAKVFYNNITSVDKNGNEVTAGEGEKSVSVGIVSKFNPENLISQEFYDRNEWTSIFIMLVTIAVMLYTAFIFASIALIFVARVASLWLVMIFSPIAFASYTVKFDIPGFGHKEWWKMLFDNALLAPIFIFFLFLIIKFSGFLGTTFANTDDTNIGTMFSSIMKVLIPFIIIIVLLQKAKEGAVKAAGEMGKTIVGAGAVLGGLAIGGAALGTAFVGRNFAGRISAGLSRREGAVNYGEARHKYRTELNKWEHEGKKGERPKWENFKPTNTGFLDSVGGRINANQKKSGNIEHARHEIDELKKKLGLENVDDAFLSGVEKKKMEDTFIKDKRDLLKNQIREGFDEKGNKIDVKAKDQNRQEISVPKESEYKKENRDSVTAEIRQDERNVDANTGKLTTQAEKKVEDILNERYGNLLNQAAGVLGKEKFKHLEEEAGQKIGMKTKMVSRMTGGTYDVRNVANLKTDKRDFFGSKLTIGLIAAAATGIRQGLKKGLGANIGTAKGDLLKDLGSTITEALKGAKINIKVGGEEKGGHDKSHAAHAPTESHHGGGHGETHGGGGHGGEEHGGGEHSH